MAGDFITLNTGYRMPTMTMGYWCVSPKDARTTTRAAIECGYRHIDSAWMYGNEKEIGDSLQELYKEGKVKREEMFITSKLWPQFNNPKYVRKGFMESLNNLQTEYLDLFLIHFPCALPKTDDIIPQDENGTYLHDTGVHYADTWKEVEKLQKEGLVRSIGISNFNEYQINRILKDCSIKPAVHQIESQPYLADVKHIEFCKRNGIAVMTYAVLGSKTRFWATDKDPVVLEDPVLKSIAEKAGKSVAQIAIRFQIQRGVAAIAKSVQPERIKSNFQVYDFRLTKDEMKLIYGLDKKWRAFDMAWFLRGHKYWAHQENYSED
uniref:LOW QUALITY PROTEIN: aldo-keto reductase family 1 member B7-like n=1 Tax=Styela clava TaxID=7725 RepID=UPI001939D5FE|nr:LOW QUALITY PROTEIN: aldo-keto reductase family 1 member B7-like [Styela clava]